MKKTEKHSKNEQKLKNTEEKHQKENERIKRRRMKTIIKKN